MRRLDRFESGALRRAGYEDGDSIEMECSDKVTRTGIITHDASGSLFLCENRAERNKLLEEREEFKVSQKKGVQVDRPYQYGDGWSPAYAAAA